MIIDISTPTLFTLHMSVRFAPNIHHLPERFGSFTIMVLGISILGVVDGISSHKWSVESFTIMVLGISILGVVDGISSHKWSVESFTIIVLGISILGVVDGISSHKWTAESITDGSIGTGDSI